MSEKYSIELIPISTAGRILKKHDYTRLIMVYVKEDANGNDFEYGVTTYGKTKELCEKTGKMGQELARAIPYFLNKEIKNENV